MLREIADAQILMGEALARDRCEHAGNRFQQRRLAGAVGAEQADSRATQNAPFDVGEHRRAGVAEARMIEQHQLTRAVSRRSERELEGTVDVRGGDQLHSLDRLDAALHLLRLRRLGAKAVDESLQMRDLTLLLRVRGLLLRERLRALALELRIVAAVNAELARVEMDDRAHDSVQKVAIVCDEEQRAGVVNEPILEP